MDLEETNKAIEEINDLSRDEDLETIDTNEGHALPEGIHFYQTSTTGYKTGRNPRTVRAAYDSSSATMYVVFWDGTYWYYEDVDVVTWDNFKRVESKGAFLWNEGFDSRGPGGMAYKNGEVDMNAISDKRRAALSSNYEVAKKLQEAYKGRRTSKTLYGKGHNYRLRGQGGFDPYK